MGTATKDISVASRDGGQDGNLHLQHFGATKNYILMHWKAFFPLRTYCKGILNNE